MRGGRRREAAERICKGSLQTVPLDGTFFFNPRYAFIKAGVMLLDLHSAKLRQGELDLEPLEAQDSTRDRLMGVLDELNQC